MSKDEHANAVGACLARAGAELGLTPLELAELIHCTPSRLALWDQCPSTLSQAHFELLMLKTGQYSFERMLLWHPSRLHLRLLSGHLVRLHLPADTLSSLARFQASYLRECSGCRHAFVGSACPDCVPNV